MMRVVLLKYTAIWMNTSKPKKNRETKIFQRDKGPQNILLERILFIV